VIVTVREELKMRAELIVAAVVVAFDGGFLERPVHPLDLPVRSVNEGAAVLTRRAFFGVRFTTYPCGPRLPKKSRAGMDKEVDLLADWSL
jgi:hypothetical protein